MKKKNNGGKGIKTFSIDDDLELENISTVELKRLINILKARKQECILSGAHEEGAKIDKRIHELKERTKIKNISHQNQLPVFNRQDKGEQPTDKASRIAMVKKLIGNQQGKVYDDEFLDNQDIEQAIIKPIQKPVVPREKKSANFQQDLNMGISITEIEDKTLILEKKDKIKEASEEEEKKILEDLESNKFDHFVNENYDEAIKTAQKILKMAKNLQFREKIKEQEDFIELVQNKFYKQTSELDLGGQIEGLKSVKKGLIVRNELEQAIKVSQKILIFAELASLKDVIKEEKSSVEDIQKEIEKQNNISEIEKECEHIDKIFDVFIVDGEIIDAHKYIEDFKKKYQHLNYFTSISGVQKILEKDEGLEDVIVKEIERSNKKRKKGKEGNDIKEFQERVTNVKTDQSPEDILEKLRVEKIKRKEEKLFLMQFKREIDTEREILEDERIKLQLENARLQDSLNKIEIGMKQIKEGGEKLRADRDRLAEETSIYLEEKAKLSEDQKAFQRDEKILADEITNFEEKKGEFENEKAHFEEIKGKIGLKEALELEIASLKEERAELKVEMIQITKEKLQLKVDKEKFEKEKKGTE